ncbi:AfsR/SARP family transcriptional regulator [Saccharothrix sp. ALI-22-I]|uniref:AfsR/SARP family transcriptional regulator n=1 Tax=Saccharothrix sp. ALI-22-I TaxID=1933778 RepID=UPI001EE72395|nr:BTAD domain-containing putative transcriptional regulator [Saccharothrix sp. ALI-22-I]
MVEGGVRYRLLGPVAAHVDGEPVRLGGPKQRAVLAALLLNANRVVSEEQLIGLIWDGEPPTSARGQLQVRIWELRKLLGRTAIVRRLPGYLIEVGPGQLDVQVFSDEVAAARADLAEGRVDAGVARLRAALALWEGPVLGGVTEALLDQESRLLEDRRLAAVEDLFDAELRAGRHAAVIGELRRVCGEYPFRERLQATLMLALHRSGRTPEALAAYAQTRRRFTDELGIEPGRELQELHVQVLQGDEPASAPVARPAQLPHDVRGFTGRQAELARLDDAGIWVITGAAGVGKTALAVHWARRVRDRFPDGQLYVDLRGFDADHEPVPPAIALAQLLRALGQQRLPSEVDELAALYRTVLADREVLVLLDNARDAEQVTPLLPPSGMVLVTSRHRLGDLVAHRGARLLPLTVLPAADSRALLTEVLGLPQSPGPSSSGPSGSAECSDSLDELARLCGHLPLALRIAAANLGSEPRVDELVAELRTDPLTGLTVDGADESPLTRAFGVSYAALTPGSQRLFRLLGLVPGADFTPRVAAALLDVPVPAAGRLLHRLAAAHLVEQHGPGRFRFHDLVRDYARTFCGEDGAWDRLVEFHLAAADAVDRHFSRHPLRLPRDADPLCEVDFASSAEAVAWLEAEHDNLTAVLRQAAVQGPHPAAWYLADAIRSVFLHRGLRAEWLDVAFPVLEAARGVPRVEALMRQGIGAACVHLGRRDEAIRHLEAALLAHRDADWPEGEAATANSLGIALLASGRYTEASELFARSLGAGTRTDRMMALNNLGFVERQLGCVETAYEHLERALAIALEDGSQWGEAVARVNLGYVLRSRGDLPGAREHLMEACALHRHLGNRYGEASALIGLSLVRTDSNDVERARADATEALTVARREENRETEVGALTALGTAEAAAGRLDQAETHHRQAVDLARRWGSPWQVAEALAALGATVASRDPAAAVTLCHEALILARQRGLRPVEALCLRQLALLT